MKLICFPHAGGFACYYNFFAERKYSVIDSIHCYEYPGRGTRMGEPEDQDFSERIFRAAEYIKSLGVKAYDYTLFGHSMGAFVACEVGKLLKNSFHLPPAVVFLSGQVPPCTYDEKQKNIMERFGGDREFMMQLGGIPQMILENPEILEYYTELTVNDFRLLKSYDPKPTEHAQKLGYGVLFCGHDDIIIDPAAFHLWNHEIDTICAEHVYPGKHFYLNDCAPLVSQEVERWTDRIYDNLKIKGVVKR